jgi:hypothetical protein
MQIPHDGGVPDDLNVATEKGLNLSQGFAVS